MADIKKLEQKRQEALDKANRMKKQIDKALNGQKFVLGGMLMAIAENEPDRIPQILDDIDKHVTRKADISRLESFRSGLSSKVPKSSLEQPIEPMERFEELVNAIKPNSFALPIDSTDDDIPF